MPEPSWDELREQEIPDWSQLFAEQVVTPSKLGRATLEFVKSALPLASYYREQLGLQEPTERKFTPGEVQLTPELGVATTESVLGGATGFRFRRPTLEVPPLAAPEIAPLTESPIERMRGLVSGTEPRPSDVLTPRMTGYERLGPFGRTEGEAGTFARKATTVPEAPPPLTPSAKTPVQAVTGAELLPKPEPIPRLKELESFEPTKPKPLPKPGKGIKLMKGLEGNEAFFRRASTAEGQQAILEEQGVFADKIGSASGLSPNELKTPLGEVLEKVAKEDMPPGKYGILRKFLSTHFMADSHPVAKDLDRIMFNAQLMSNKETTQTLERVANIFKGLDSAERKILAKRADGQITDALLTADLVPRYKALRALLDELGGEIGMKKGGRYIQDYFMRTFDPEVLIRQLEVQRKGLAASKEFGRDVQSRINDINAVIKELKTNGYIPEDVFSRLPKSAFMKNMLRRKVAGPTNFDEVDPMDLLSAYIYGVKRKKFFDPVLEVAPGYLNQLPDTLGSIMEQSLHDAMGLPGAATKGLAAKFKSLGLKSPHQVAEVMTKIQAIDKMGFQAQSVLYNATQPWTFTMAKAPLSTLKALRMLGTDEGRALIAKYGITLDRADTELLGKLSGGGLNALAKISLWPFEKVEKFNRGLSYLAGRIQAASKGAKGEAALHRAGLDMLADTQFNYAIWNRPELFRSAPGRMLFQFKMFQVSALQAIARMTPKEHAVFWGMSYLIGGPNAIPVLKQLKDAGVVGDPGEITVNDWLKIPTSFAKATGINLARGVGAGVLPNLVLDAMSTMAVNPPSVLKKAVEDLPSEMAGPTLSSLGKMVASAVNLASGTAEITSEALKLLPIAGGKVPQAFSKDAEGKPVFKTARGDVLSREITPTPYERVTMGVGLTPERLASLRDKISINQARADWGNKQKDILARRYFMADTLGKKKQIEKEVALWYQKHPGFKEEDPDAFTKRVENLYRTVDERMMRQMSPLRRKQFYEELQSMK